MISELMNDRLAGAGGTGDQQVRHLRHVGHDEAALDVLAEPGHHRVVVRARRGGPEHVAEGDDLLVDVGDLDADRRLAGDRAEDADVGGRDGVGDVLRQRRDLLDLHRGAELDLVAGDRRAAGVAGDGGVDAELVHHLHQPLDDRVAGLGARLVRRSGLERGVVGQRVGDVARQRELLHAGRQRRVRRRLDRTRVVLAARCGGDHGRGDLGGGVGRGVTGVDRVGEQVDPVVLLRPCRPPSSCDACAARGR